MSQALPGSWARGCMHGSSTSGNQAYAGVNKPQPGIKQGRHLCKMKICSPFSRHTGSQSGLSNDFALRVAPVPMFRQPGRQRGFTQILTRACARPTRGHLVNTSAGGGSCRAPVTIRYADTAEQLTDDRLGTDVFPPSSSAQLTYRSPAHSALYHMPCMPKPRIRLSCQTSDADRGGCGAD